MQVKLVNFSTSNKPQVLASVRIELTAEETADTIIIDDARVLRNRNGQLWLAMPAYSVPAIGEDTITFPPSSSPQNSSVRLRTLCPGL